MKFNKYNEFSKNHLKQIGLSSLVGEFSSVKGGSLMTYASNQKRIIVDSSHCLGCKSCELKCAVDRTSLSKNLMEAVKETVLPRPRVYVEWNGESSQPIQCRHCEDAPCLEICSTGAMQRDPTTGITFVEGNKCIACWMCVMVCPYGVIAPATEKKSADKCDQCYQMPEPNCVAACPTGALKVMTSEEFSAYLKEHRQNEILLQKDKIG